MKFETKEPIAIVGVGCRFPGGVNDVDSYWRLLRSGADAVGEVPTDRWDFEALYSKDPTTPGKTYATRGGFLPSIDGFDPEFFKISPREAAHIDPQQRLLLETAYEAMEDAGELPSKLSGARTGVFVGIFIHDYQHIQFNERHHLNAHTGTGTAMSIAANRVSYAFNLSGPSMAVDTACSSSLLAIHLACQSIHNGECDTALAGGVNLIIRPEMTIAMSKASMLSPDGRCFSFDSRANGYVRGEGAGLVLLKPLSAALNDKNPIYSLVIGSACNQDGRTVGISVPNGSAQETLLHAAIENAGIEPSDIGYVEAHGTGTPVGDPIEANALGRVLSNGRADGETCVIGSVKSNMGHLESASGVAGLIKAALALKNGKIPRNLNFEEVNPKIDLPALKLRVPIELEDWQQPTEKIAGVNSFGFGGTNVHVLLKEPPKRKDTAQLTNGAGSYPPTGRDTDLIKLSAHSPEALSAQAEQISRYVEDNQPVLADLAYTLASRRGDFGYRATLLVDDQADLQRQLVQLSKNTDDLRLANSDNTRPGPLFVFTGMGPQWWAMGRELLEQEPVFEQTMRSCDQAFLPLTGWSLLEELAREEGDSRVQETTVAQPAIFSIQVALANLWRSWGVVPSAVMGHSVGEVSAAHVAGILSLDDAVRLSYYRSQLQYRMRGTGTMLAVGASEKDVTAMFPEAMQQVSIAAVNSPTSVTLSGDAEVLGVIARKLENKEIFNRPLIVEVPYHSSKMDPLQEDLLASLATLTPKNSQIPYISTVTGGELDGPQLHAEYWWRNVRQPVYFAKALMNWCLREEATELPPILEVGPHPVLSGAIRECLEAVGKTAPQAHSLRREQQERKNLLRNLSNLYQHGTDVDWKSIYPEGKLLNLPNYPWQPISCWAESEDAASVRKGYAMQTLVAAKGKTHPLLGARLQLANTVWNQTIDLDRYPYLRDHKIQGEVVFPGAGYIEMACAAVDVDWDKEHCVVENLRLSKALFVPPTDAVSLQFAIDADNSFAISSLSESQSGWDRHCQGHVRKQATRLCACADIEAILARCTRELPVDYLYELFGHIGFHYGKDFQRIIKMHQGVDECLARITPFETDGADGDGDGYNFHPAWLDASLHCIFGALSLTAEDADMRDQAYLPVSIKSCRLVNKPQSMDCWSHARITKKGEHSFTANVMLYGDDGLPILDIRQLRCEAIDYSSENLQKHAAQWLYSFDWQLEDIPTREVDKDQVWLVLTNEQSEWISTAFRDREQKLVEVKKANTYKKLGESLYQVDPSCREHYQQLVQDLAAAGVEIHNVVHGFAFDAPRGDALDVEQVMSRQSDGFGSVVYLLQSLSSLSKMPAALRILTCEASECDNTSNIHLAQSPLFGLVRVLGNEHPELASKIIDLGERISADDLDDIYREIAPGADEEEVTLRDGRRYVRRLIRREGKSSAVATLADGRAFSMEFRESGHLDSLCYVPMPLPLPGPNEVLIKVSHASLNFKDVLKASGLFPIDLMEENLWSGDTLGMECAGVVLAHGSQVRDLSVGNRVMALAPHSLRSHTVTVDSLVVPISSLGDEEAAAMPMVFMTAYYGLVDLARLSKGDRVLIHAAAGGVGQAAIQLAQWVGAEVYATASNDEKRSFLQSLGVEHIYDSRSPSFAQDILADTDEEGVDVVLNSLAGPLIDLSLSLLRDYGRFVEIGKMDINRNKPIGMKPFHYNLSFFAVDLDRMLQQRPGYCGAMLARIHDLYSSGDLQPLKSTCYPANQAQAAFKSMLSGGHMGKLVVSFAEADQLEVNAPTAPVFQSDASYLITGGLGGFGSSLARWLVERGCRHLSLLGRSGATSPAAQRLVKDLETMGAQVTVIKADISDRADVETIINSVNPDVPVRGVFHAAGVLDDALLLKQDMQKFERVAATKIRGSLNLHELSQRWDLECFVLFSSVATTLGNQGSGNYAAANGFMDSLAHFRKANGQPALSVNWGVIADVGMAADEDFYRRSLEENGLRALHSRDGLELMGMALCDGDTQITISPIDWEKWLRFNPAGATTRFGDLADAQAQGQASSQSAEEQGLREKFDSLPEDEVKEVAIAEVQEILSKLFGFDANRLLPEQALTSLGMDSLMAVELKAKLDRFGVSLPVATLLRDTSVAKIVDVMLDTFDIQGAAGKGVAGQTEPQREGAWIVTPHPRPDAKYRMFCFPYAGAGPVVFQDWHEALSPEIEVCAVHLPGRAARLGESPLTRIEQMKKAVAGAMGPMLDKPVIFFGHCMGAIVMYEVAAQLKLTAGIEPHHVFVSGCMAPHLYNSPMVYALGEQKFLEVLDLISFTSAGALHKDKEVLDLMTPMLRADFEAVAHYAEAKTDDVVFSAPITGFAANHDLFAAPCAMRAWGGYTSSEFRLNLLDGDHYFIESDRDIILDEINHTLGLSTSSSSHRHRFEVAEVGAISVATSQVVYGRDSRRHLAGHTNPNLLHWPSRYSPRKNTLLCFPGAWETSPSPAYLPLSMGEHWQVAVVQYPGHGLRKDEACTENIQDIVEELLPSVLDYIGRPFGFFGHCFGGIIQYELAKRLKLDGYSEPEFMVVSGVVSPTLYTAPNGHLLDDGKLAELLNVIDCPLLDSFDGKRRSAPLRNLVRSDLMLMANYTCDDAPKLDCPITAVAGKRDLWTYPLQVSSWHDLTTSFDTKTILHEGNHFMSQQDVELFSQCIHQRFSTSSSKSAETA